MALAITMLSQPAHAMDEQGLAFSAICAEQYGEHDIFNAAFALYEKENPRGLSREKLDEVRQIALASVDTREIEANPMASRLTRGICDKARAALLP